MGGGFCMGMGYWRGLTAIAPAPRQAVHGVTLVAWLLECITGLVMPSISGT